jgi:integrase
VLAVFYKKNGKKTVKMNHKFTVPKINSNKDLTADWYVYFTFNKKLVKKRFGINYIKDYDERMLEAVAVQKILHQKLKEGWNPFFEDIYKYDSDLNVYDALEFALKCKTPNIADRTNKDYRISLNFFQAAAKKLTLDRMPVLELKRIHVKAIFDKIKIDRKWSNKSYNKNLGYIKAIFSELVTENIIENNPAHLIKTLKVANVEANVVATDDEVLKIKEKLLNDFPSFYVFVICIFHTGIRPKELLSITVDMVDLKKNQIVLNSDITKNGNSRVVPINKFLKVYFENMKLSKFDKSFFVFGSKREFTNRGLKKDLDFVPAPHQLSRDCASKLWRVMIKEKLGINVNLYSMKHLGANKKILAGMDLDSLRELYGHSSQLMTLKYAKNVKEIHRNQIMENSPDF